MINTNNWSITAFLPAQGRFADAIKPLAGKQPWKTTVSNFAIPLACVPTSHPSRSVSTQTSMGRLLLQCSLILIVFFAIACNRKSEYERIVETELAKGVTNDSLFLGIELGMTSKEFFAHCWELNKQGLIQQGTQNTTVLYQIDDLEHEATMEFYPDFYEDKIYEMPAVFAYKAWAPWNKHLSADSLQQDVLHLFEQQYGKGFIKVEHSKKGAAYVKVDGNRRITIFRQDDVHVKALFTDLLVDQEIKENTDSDLRTENESGNDQ